MATPRGAQPRDLEQRFRDLEQRCGDLAARVLGQRKLEVTTGDFVVSGGGGIVVRNGGGIISEYPNGQTGLQFGPVTPSPPYDHGLMVRRSDGVAAAYFVQKTDGTFIASVGGTQALSSADLTAVSTYVGQRPFTSQLSLSGTTIGIDSGAGGISLYTDGALHLGDGTTTSVYLGHTTTSSAANARLETTGQLLRSTSSRRYKQDIETAQVDPAAVLSLEPRTWRDRAQVADDPDTDRRYVGFIAEELDEAGLGQFVEYDDQGRPDAIQYDRLSAALLVVVKQQQQQLDALTARVDALTA